MKIRVLIMIIVLSAFSVNVMQAKRDKYNFNSDWRYIVSGQDSAAFFSTPFENKKEATQVTLPRAFNEDEAFRVAIHELTDTICWYFKTFRLPKKSDGKKVFIEFEGVRQAATVYINGHKLGMHQDGVMAFGFDLTPYMNFKGDNEIAVMTDNNWNYREQNSSYPSRYQWHSKNFNANYGGIPKNVFLHITEPVYQTLPLFSNLETTGVYVFALNHDIKARKADIHVESEIKNETEKDRKITLETEIFDLDGKSVSLFKSAETILKPGEMKVVKANSSVENLNFWSWGYGYLYDVKTRIIESGKCIDEVNTKTGFRKTAFGEGKVWLNDRAIMLKGYAQRTSNEWPSVGMSVPAWLSDYSNDMMVKSNANLVRWMHVTPWKQDIESCDRVGLIQAMPAGDAEKDASGRQWEHRTTLMRDAIIYNRNNPSIIFYECGNESISREHMIEMKEIRDKYDPYGGRAIGSREMLDINEAEYGGEMLYINKSGKHPMWAMEYCRDESCRRYWDDYSFPYHKNGDGPLYKGKDATAYNLNQDMFTIEHIRRWYDYWLVRPGMGKRVSSGGVKIIFSDTNTHFRGETNYRTSGIVDAMRIPKDSYFAHQVMWNGWVDIEDHKTYIIGHWNYKTETKKPVYVVSTSPVVELFVNDKSLGKGLNEYEFLHTFEDVTFEKGNLKAIGYDIEGNKESEYQLTTVGAPKALKLTLITDKKGFKSDGADMALIEIEVIDENGLRCPLENTLIKFELEGPAEWRGGTAGGTDNYILSKSLPVECGVNRVLVRSTTKPGNVILKAVAEGFEEVSVSWESKKYNTRNGLSSYIAAENIAPVLDRGATPETASYADRKRSIDIESAIAGFDSEKACRSFDDNELSEWKNDGRLSTGWITYKLKEKTEVDEISIKLTGWRMRSYPLDIYAGDELVYSGDTEKSLGYITLPLKKVKSDTFTIRLKGSVNENDAFGQIVEVAAPVANELDLFRVENAEKTGNELRIIEIDFLQNM